MRAEDRPGGGAQRFQVREECGGRRFAVWDGDHVVFVLPVEDPSDPASVTRTKATAERVALSPRMEEIARQLRIGPTGDEGALAFTRRITALVQPVVTGAAWPS